MIERRASIGPQPSKAAPKHTPQRKQQTSYKVNKVSSRKRGSSRCELKEPYIMAVLEGSTRLDSLRKSHSKDIYRTTFLNPFSGQINQDLGL